MENSSNTPAKGLNGKLEDRAYFFPLCYIKLVFWDHIISLSRVAKKRKNMQVAELLKIIQNIFVRNSEL